MITLEYDDAITFPKRRAWVDIINDTDPFVTLVTGGAYQAEADMNSDGAVNGLDVDPFVAAVVGGAQMAVPEPETLLLALAAGLTLLGARRRRNC